MEKTVHQLKEKRPIKGVGRGGDQVQEPAKSQFCAQTWWILSNRRLQIRILNDQDSFPVTVGCHLDAPTLLLLGQGCQHQQIKIQVLHLTLNCRYIKTGLFLYKWYKHIPLFTVHLQFKITWASCILSGNLHKGD